MNGGCKSIIATAGSTMSIRRFRSAPPLRRWRLTRGRWRRRWKRPSPRWRSGLQEMRPSPTRARAGLTNKGTCLEDQSQYHHGLRQPPTSPVVTTVRAGRKWPGFRVRIRRFKLIRKIIPLFQQWEELSLLPRIPQRIRRPNLQVPPSVQQLKYFHSCPPQTPERKIRKSAGQKRKGELLGV